MSFLRRLWGALTKPSYYVGSDLKGNRFFEHPSVSSDPRRTRRRVEYKDLNNMWENIGRGPSIPVQWSAWMHHTRHDPPTIEELEADLHRQQRVLVNVAQLEARDRQQREDALRLRDPTSTDTPDPHIDAVATSDDISPPPVQGTAEPGPSPPAPKGLPKIPPQDSYEPEAWTPRPASRGD